MIEQENSLETALRLAANEPASRPDFYKILLESSVFILGQADRPIDGKATIEADEKIAIQNWEKSDGSPVIPFFSSLANLQQILDKEAKYLMLPARSLFELTKGASLVLNPKLKYGKEFFPNEIEALLIDKVNQTPEQRVTQKEAKVLLGQPANYPSKMVDSLSEFFSKRQNIKAAYLAMMHDPSVDEKPRLVVGIDVDGNVDQTMREAGVVAGDSADTGEPVDLFQLHASEAGLSDYFRRSVKPFYVRSLGGKLKSLLGIGIS